MYDTLPKSMKQELICKVRDEDPEVQKQRQELTRSKSPVELSQISSLSDFPVPTTIEKMMQKPRLVIQYCSCIYVSSYIYSILNA